MQHVRRLTRSWHQELVDTYLWHQLVPLIDSPVSALPFRLAHRSGTNLSQKPAGGLGRRHLCVTGIVNAAIRRARRYGFVAPVSSAHRFTSERAIASLGSSEWHESEPAANGRRRLCVTGIVRRVKDAEDGHER
jgi:hypothetical protein